MKKMLFVMNPNAGQRKAGRSLAQLVGLFNQAGYEVTVFMTAGAGYATELVRRRAAGADLVVCCGGDGTFNETVAGVLSSGAQVPVGYLPAGSTNDFAASLKLPTELTEAAQVVIRGQAQPHDVGRFNRRYFTYVASFGVFTKASYATPQSLKNTLGHMAYLLEGIQELSQIRREHVRLEPDGYEALEDDYIFGAVCNATTVGGVLNLDPERVDLADGRFELLLIRYPEDLAEVSECIRALKNQDYSSRMLTFLSTTGVTVTAREDMTWTLDGEPEQGHEQIRIQCLHHAIQLIQKGKQDV